jgi:CRP/FNR family transcriptional regulator, anaerobic regulatory protein
MPHQSDIVVIETANPVLRDCAASTRAALLERGRLERFRDDTTLLADGQVAGVVLFPLNGTLQMAKATTRGRRQIFCDPTSSSCGGICMLAFGNHALAEVHGLEDGEVLILKRSDFEDLIHEDRVLCRAAWHSAASCMAHLSSLVTQLSFNKVAERVVLSLLDNTDKDGDLVRLTQADLAAEVGTTREVVARCLAGLQADGLIRLGRARITVLSREGLRASL